MNKVLIIEDDEAIRENTAELLGLHQYDVATAENGRSGFLQVKSYQPDLVLCDMMMPETDGRGFLKLVRNDDSLRHIPIIFFSAGTLPFEEQKALVKSADGFLKKPFAKEDLLRAIQETLDRRSHRSRTA